MNQISGTSPAAILMKNKNLVALDVGTNKLEKIEIIPFNDDYNDSNMYSNYTNVGSNSSLTYLLLNENKIEDQNIGKSLNTLFKAHPNLEILTLNDNSGISGDFGNFDTTLSNLKQLTMI